MGGRGGGCFDHLSRVGFGGDRLPIGACGCGVRTPRYTPGVSRRLVAILLVVLIGARALMGGVSGAVVLCLDGGHEHAPTEVVEACELACAHETGLTTAVVADAHDCGCVDIEFSLAELRVLPRFDAEGVPVVLADPAGPWVISAVGAVVAWTGPPAGPGFDPGLAHRLAVVSSTRLTI